MKKKIIGLLIGLMMLATVPLAAGMYTDINTSELCSETEPTGDDSKNDSKKTIVVGITTKPRIIFLGKFVMFRAIKVRYLVVGEGRTVSVDNFQRLFFKNDFYGVLGNHFVLAIFDGKPLAL